MKTEKDIRAYLRKKGYLEDISDYVVEKMRSYGYLDDAAYARAYIEHAGKRKGSRLIAMELRQKGVSDEAIEEALSGVSGEAGRGVLGPYKVPARQKNGQGDALQGVPPSPFQGI